MSLKYFQGSFLVDHKQQEKQSYMQYTHRLVIHIPNFLNLKHISKRKEKKPANIFIIEYTQYDAGGMRSEKRTHNGLDVFIIVRIYLKSLRQSPVCDWLRVREILNRELCTDGLDTIH